MTETSKDIKQAQEEAMQGDPDAHLYLLPMTDCQFALWKDVVSLFTTWLINPGKHVNNNSADLNQLHTAYAYSIELVQKTLLKDDLSPAESRVEKDQHDDALANHPEGLNQISSLWQACQEVHENVINQIEKR